MYAFPNIKFSDKAKEAAFKQQMEPDLMYCLDTLEKIGLLIVPGSGFGQKEGSSHFRISNLITNRKEMDQLGDDLFRFNKQFHEQYL
jgi:alanine transaminase